MNHENTMTPSPGYSVSGEMFSILLERLLGAQREALYFKDKYEGSRRAFNRTIERLADRDGNKVSIDKAITILSEEKDRM